jgi:hypothetical protein
MFALAIVLFAIGGSIYGWCVFDFASFGRGTPAPIDPPKKLASKPSRTARLEKVPIRPVRDQRFPHSLATFCSLPGTDFLPRLRYGIRAGWFRNNCLKTACLLRSRGAPPLKERFLCLCLSDCAAHKCLVISVPSSSTRE